MHHGEILEHVIRRDKLSITEVARRLGVSRRSVYNWFSKETLSVEIISKVGLVLRHDFSGDFPDLFQNGRLRDVNSDGATSGQDNHHSVQYWRNKYISLLEKYNEFLSQRSLPAKLMTEKTKFKHPD